MTTKQDIHSDSEVQAVPVDIAAGDVVIGAEEPRASEKRAFEARPVGRGRSSRDRAPRGDKGPRHGRGGSDDRRSEFSQKLIGIRRVARVMAGGRRFNFSVSMVLGDKGGRVGVGMGKAADTALAIDKATRDAKKNMITVPITKNKSIPYNVQAKYCASSVELRPSPGRGLVAGSSVRTVLELGGITDVTAKILSRSHNPINNARAAIEALKKLRANSKK